MKLTIRHACAGWLLLAWPVCAGATGAAANQPAPPPAHVLALSRQWRVDLLWDAAGAGATYEVQRAPQPGGPFTPLPARLPGVNAYSDFIGRAGGDYFYRVRAIRPGGTNGAAAASAWSEIRSGSPKPLDPEGLLDEVQEAGFRYFFDFAHPVSGLARVGTSKDGDVCSIGGTGWGLYNLVVGVQRGFVSREEGAKRTLQILRFLSNKADRFHGAFPHWINGATGKVVPFKPLDDGADLVETGFLTEGLLLVREYFSGQDQPEVEIRKLADGLWRSVEWDWFAQEKNGHPCLFWHWSPQFGWQKNHAISGFNECQIIYVLALASPTHPIPPRYYWQGWESTYYGTEHTEFGVRLTLGRELGPPLFWTHYSYLGLDPRQISYGGKSYFQHFQDFCHVQILYADSRRAEFKGYGPLWGLTASHGPNGYKAFAPGRRDNGTISPTAALSSMPYVPEQSRAFLLNLYEQYGARLWGPFGFYDAFNLTRDWISVDYLGNDVGPICPMIENYRSGLCWNTFMKAPEIHSVIKVLANPPQPGVLARRE